MSSFVECGEQWASFSAPVDDDSLHDAQMQQYILLRYFWALSKHIGTNTKQPVPGQGASSMQPGLLHPEN